MDVAVAESHAATTQPIFADGFGERRCIVDAHGDGLDVLTLRPIFSSGSAVEFVLRERAARLARFQHESFSRVRAVELDKPSNALLVVSDHVPGERLSVLLAAAEKSSRPLEAPAARCLIRQLVSAMAAWQGEMPDIAHGAIGPERIVVTPAGRLVVVECVLGSALKELRYSPEQYWNQLRVMVPASGGPIDARADVAQIGLVALALMLGRSVVTTDPASIRRALDRALIGSDGRAPLSAAWRDWVLRALQFDSESSFASATEALMALEPISAEQVAGERDALRLFVVRGLVRADGTTQEVPELDLGARIEALRAFLNRHPTRDGETATESASASAPAPAADESPARDASVMLGQNPMQKSAAPLPNTLKRRLSIAAAVVFVVGAIIAAVVMFGFNGMTGVERPGTLSIVTNPGSAGVVVDGEARGVTPVTIELPPGNHIVEVTTETGVRRMPVTIEAGGVVSQYLELPRSLLTDSGQLVVRTDPPAASVTVDGRFIGRSPVSVGDLAPGTHKVALEHGALSVTEQVLIESGRTASLVVPMVARPAPGVTAGWIAVTAPADVQIYEDGRLLGTNTIDRIMLPVGSHDVEIVNAALGYRERRTLQVSAGKVTTVPLTWPMGTLALNAVPWAEAFIDGTSVGETPIGGTRVPVGTHEVVFRHPQLGERRTFVTVVVGQPARVGVDLRAR